MSHDQLADHVRRAAGGSGPVSIRIGVGLRQFGPWGAEIATQARRAESAGFESVWLGDHILSPLQVRSRYPYTDSGDVPWQSDVDMYDTVICAGVAATVTSQITIGFGTLVVPLRQPVVLAKQLATIDRLSGGRVILGAGVGWCREEFTALGASFDDRFAVMAEWIGVMRACWTGRPGVIRGRHYELGVEAACYPTPAGRLPILIGGASTRAMELAARWADGWYPLLSEEQLDPRWLAPRWERIRSLAGRSGRDPAALALTVYAAANLDLVCARLPDLIAVGVQEVVVGVDWDIPGAVDRAGDQLRDARKMAGRPVPVVPHRSP
jgi:probable F420-dependent oxidoreductase